MVQTEARRLYNGCSWTPPSDDQLSELNSPPTSAEIAQRLSRASNTSPGEDKLEYRHLRLLDPKGLLLEIIFSVVWRIGIPETWKSSRTIPIFKKGVTTDLSNFRPISLLSTMYKIFSGALSQRITSVAADLGWLSPEQKGFLLGVNGIQEHTQLLQTVVEFAKDKSNKSNLSLAFLDLRNAFGSIPHPIINELLYSLPIPVGLRNIILDIYSANLMNFSIGKEVIPIRPTAGVRQGDALSTIVFNLAAEPIIRSAKNSPGFLLYGTVTKVTAFADDLALMASSVDDLQDSLIRVNCTAETLGLEFNASKCVCMNVIKGKILPASLYIAGGSLRSLKDGDTQDYLGIPIGAKLKFRTDTQLIGHLDMLKDAPLLPWQKLEIYRSHLLPSLSHHLASGYCVKGELHKLDVECRMFLGAITSAPKTTTTEFYYANRRVGGLGTFKLTDDADVWTIARATQLLTSRDTTIRAIFREQLLTTINKAFPEEYCPTIHPVSAFLSGFTETAMYRLRNGLNPSTTLWGAARRAARRLKVRVDVSGDWNISIIADDVRSPPPRQSRASTLRLRSITLGSSSTSLNKGRLQPLWRRRRPRRTLTPN